VKHDGDDDLDAPSSGRVRRPTRAGRASVRVLPPHLVEEAIEAVQARPGSAPPKLLRPERLDDVTDVVRVVRAGEPVVLQVDRLDEAEQLRAIDVATGIAAALDATISSLESTPAVSIAPRQRMLRRSRSEPDGEPVPARVGAPDDPPPGAELCALCEIRSATRDFDPPLELVVNRDGSRGWAPRVAICDRCQRTVRNWRFAVAWCSQCERWGRRGVRSPCSATYGA
jgi:Cell division protein SepF